MKKIIYTILLAMAVVIALVLVSSIDKSSEISEIIIGAPLSLTGSASTDGQSIQRGIELAKEDLLRKGIRVKVIYEDDSTDPKRTVSAVTKMISVDKVQAIIGPTWSFLLDSVGSIINENKIVSYSPANTSEFINTNSPYIFFGAVKNSQKIAPTVQWLKSMKSKKVAIIVDKSNWGESLLTPLSEATKRAGAEIILVEKIPFGGESSSIPTILAKVKAIGVDTVLWSGFEEGTTVVVKKIQELKLDISFLSVNMVIKGLVKNSTVFINSNDRMYLLETRGSEIYSQKFYDKYKEYPSTYSDSAYDGLMILVEAIRNKKPDQTIDDYLRNNTNYKGFQSDYKFDQNGDITGGEWVVEKLK